jgi:hypothetical protein
MFRSIVFRTKLGEKEERELIQKFRWPKAYTQDRQILELGQIDDYNNKYYRLLLQKRCIGLTQRPNHI